MSIYKQNKTKNHSLQFLETLTKIETFLLIESRVLNKLIIYLFLHCKSMSHM